MIFIGGGREGLAFGVHAQPTIGCRQWTFGAALAKAKCCCLLKALLEGIVGGGKRGPVSTRRGIGPQSLGKGLRKLSSAAAAAASHWGIEWEGPIAAEDCGR